MLWSLWCPQKGDAAPQHLHLSPELHDSYKKHRHTCALQRHPSWGTKSFNQVPEASQLPSEVKFDKKGVKKGDYSPLGSIKDKQADPTLLQGLQEERLPSLSTLRSCCYPESVGGVEYKHTLGSNMHLLH